MSLIYDDKMSSQNSVSQKKNQRIRDKVANTNFDYIFNKKTLERNICINLSKIKANQFNKNINNTLEKILNENISGICIEEGYVKPNSCKILLRSEGNIDISNFKSTIYYTIKYEALICNPVEGDKIKCYVSDVNKTNIRGYVVSEDESPLNIFLPKQHNSGNDEYINIKEGDLIEIMIMNKKYEYLDREILVIGKFISIQDN